MLTTPMPHLGSVTAMIGFGAGSRCETKDIQGIAHFTEHMLFEGTKRRPSTSAISSELDSLGAKFNAGTSQEMTVYYVKHVATISTASAQIPTGEDMRDAIVAGATARAFSFLRMPTITERWQAKYERFKLGERVG